MLCNLLTVQNAVFWQKKTIHLLTLIFSWKALWGDFLNKRLPVMESRDLVLAAPDSEGAPRRPGSGSPTMFMCLAICATCVCHLVIFSEKSFFVDANNNN